MIASSLLLGPTVIHPLYAVDWCFLFAITFFVVVDFVTVTQIHAKDNTVLAVITIVGATIQVLGYLMIAISNPGIITQADFDTE